MVAFSDYQHTLGDMSLEVEGVMDREMPPIDDFKRHLEDMNVKEVAKWYRVSVKTVREWADAYAISDCIQEKKLFSFKKKSADINPVKSVANKSITLPNVGVATTKAGM